MSEKKNRTAKSKMFTLWLPNQLRERIDKLANETGRTRAAFAVEMMERCIGDIEEKYLIQNKHSATSPVANEKVEVNKRHVIKRKKFDQATLENVRSKLEKNNKTKEQDFDLEEVRNRYN